MVKNHQTPLHIDDNAGSTIAVCVGEYEGGQLYVEGLTELVDLKHRWYEFDSSKFHGTAKFSGTRFAS